MTHKVSLRGNRGICTPDPGEEENVDCGICGTRMKVTRNVLGPTGSIEAMHDHKHLHDNFICPFYEETWHERIVLLVDEASSVVSRKLRRLIEEEIAEILKLKKSLNSQ